MFIFSFQETRLVNVTTVLPDGTVQVTHLNETSINYVVTDLRRDTDYIHYYINWFQFLSSGLVPGMLRDKLFIWGVDMWELLTELILAEKLQHPAMIKAGHTFGITLAYFCSRKFE